MCMEKFWKNRQETITVIAPGDGDWGSEVGGRQYKRCIYYLLFKNHVPDITFQLKFYFSKLKPQIS